MAKLTVPSNESIPDPIPPLSDDQQFELGWDVRLAASARALRPFMTDTDVVDEVIARGVHARGALLLGNQELIVEEIEDEIGKGFRQGPLVQQVESGLDEAVDTFDPNTGELFPDFARPIVRQAIDFALTVTFEVTPEEHKVLQLLKAGNSIRVISEAEDISGSVIRRQRDKAWEKLGHKDPLLEDVDLSLVWLLDDVECEIVLARDVGEPIGKTAENLGIARSTLFYIYRRALDRMRTGPQPEDLHPYRLTEEEQEALALRGQGYTYREISAIMHPRYPERPQDAPTMHYFFERIFQKVEEAGGDVTIASLTGAQIKVYNLLQQGWKPADIAREVNITHIYTTIKLINKKLGTDLGNRRTSFSTELIDHVLGDTVAATIMRLFQDEKLTDQAIAERVDHNRPWVNAARRAAIRRLEAARQEAEGGETPPGTLEE